MSLYRIMVSMAFHLGLDTFSSELVSVQDMVQHLMHTLDGTLYPELLWKNCRCVSNSHSHGHAHLTVLYLHVPVAKEPSQIYCRRSLVFYLLKVPSPS